MCYRCNVCGVKFEDYSSLDEHGKTHDDEKFAGKRDVCNVNLSEISSQNDMDEKTKVSYRCNVCGMKFEEHSFLEAHGRSHDQDQFTYKMDVFDINFPEIFSCADKIHRQTNITYKCSACGVKFEEYSSLEVHERTHDEKFSNKRGVYDVNCSEISSASSDKVDEQRLLPAPSCDVHGVKAEENTSRKGHGKAHPASQLMLKQTHTGEKPFKCDICDKRFKWRSHLVRHKWQHTGERPFKCDICDRRFLWRNYLVMHIRSHTAERPFKCDICDKRFTWRNYLEKHIQSHTAERPFKCDICDKRFKWRNYLEKHIRLHTGERLFKCDICNKRFAWRNCLVKHIQSHTGERPFKCDICDKKFTSRSNLVRHKQTHTGERPFKCDICDKRFKEKNHLVRHKQTHTGNR